MIVDVTYLETGQTIRVDMPNLNESTLADLQKEHTTNQQLREHLERLPVSAEVKAILFNLAKFTIRAGETIILLGKRLVEVGLTLANKYPNATMGVIVAALLSALIALVPVIGPAIVSFLAPLMMLYGLVDGFLTDFKSSKPKLAEDIREATAFAAA